MPSKKTSPDAPDNIAGHVASKFPKLTRKQATFVVVVGLLVGGVGYTAYQMRGQTHGSGATPALQPASTPSSSGDVVGGNKVSVGGNVTGEGINIAGGDVNITNPLPKRTTADLRITEVRRRNGGVFVVVTNAGAEEVEMIKGTITAQVIPEYVGQVNGTLIDLIPSKSRIAPNGTADLFARSSDSSIWYVTEIKVGGERNDDPDVRNSHYTFSRSSNMFIIPGTDKRNQTWSAVDLNRLRSN